MIAYSMAYYLLPELSLFPTEPALHWVNNQETSKSTMKAECGSWCCASSWCALTTELGTCSPSPWPHGLLGHAAGKSFKSRDLEKLALQQLEAWEVGMVARCGFSPLR